MEISSDDALLVLKKRRAIWGILVIGAIFGILTAVFKSAQETSRPVDILFSVLFGFCVLEWCLADSHQRKELLTKGRRVLLIWLPFLGLPVYFINSRGFVGATKIAYGFFFYLLLLGSAFIFAALGVLVRVFIA